MKSSRERTYLSPIFNVIKIDQEISLVMTSGEAPPQAPNEGTGNSGDDKNKDDSFKTQFDE